MESTNMSDLGESYPSHPCGCSDCADREEGKNEKKKHYPRESFTTEQMPSLQGMNVGDKVRVVLECEICSVSKGDEYAIGPADGEDGEEIKTRVSIKMLQGSATRMNEKTGTVAEQQKQKEKDFSKTIGLDDEEGGEEKKDTSEAK